MHSENCRYGLSLFINFTDGVKRPLWQFTRVLLLWEKGGITPNKVQLFRWDLTSEAVVLKKLTKPVRGLTSRKESIRRGV